MTIRDARPWNKWRAKANQQWELAGCARQDGDMKASAEHTEKAREYDRLANEQGAEK
jgi:hypothetical protein